MPDPANNVDPTKGNNPPPTPAADSVTKEEHEKVMGELNRQKNLFGSLQKERDDFKSRLEAIEKKKSEDSGDFKNLYEAEKKNREELEGKYQGLKTSMVVSEKHKAASAALVKAGIAADMLQILDSEGFEDLQHEATTQGRILIHGVDLFVDKFKKRFPSAFPKGSAPPINTGGGGSPPPGDGEEMTGAKLFQIEQECKRKNDMKPYYEAHKKFLEQKKKKQTG